MPVQLIVTPGLGRRKGCHCKTCTRALSLACMMLTWGSHRALQKKHWPMWERAGWPKEANVSNLLLLLLRGEEALLPSTRNCRCTLGCYYSFTIKLGAKEESWSYQRLQNKSTQEMGRHSSIGVYWFFNCWAHLAAKRVIGLKWATRKKKIIAHFKDE